MTENQASVAALTNRLVQSNAEVERLQYEFILISRMELANNKLLEELRNRNKALEENKRLLQDQAMQHKVLLDDANSQLKIILKKLSNSKKRIKLQRVVAKYVVLNDDFKKNYADIIEQYADVIGHHNPKQRIKHVIWLIDKNYELEQVCGITALAICFFSVLHE
ncbi:hypothetical protein PUN28_019417 [Cardiocondyla obscurior]|uniref:Hyaluronan-mediated motility receptor C-terminal domain-containing protein n=1 Tax=Cardiocondyla obscurior TaxID=286306 RepID=A0AAW2EFF9_9HYME